MTNFTENEGFMRLCTQIAMSLGAFITIVWRFISGNYSERLSFLSSEIQHAKHALEESERKLSDCINRVSILEATIKNDAVQFPKKQQKR